MKKLLSIIGVIASLTSWAQYNITEGGTVEIECGPPTTLTDSDANGGAYENDEWYEMTFCPGDGGSIVSVGLDVELGDTWDVPDGDFIYVYDGPDTGADLIGAYNSVTDPDGFTAFATIENTSGCVTIVFTSDDAVTGAGFGLTLTCFLAPQPFSIDIETVEDANPLDSSEVLICNGETVEFTANGIFPYDGIGYEQNNANCYFEWSFGDGETVEGFGSDGFDQVSHTYDGMFGYQVWVVMTDIQGWTSSATINVLVSTVPNFSASGTPFDDFCAGQEVYLTGWYDVNTGASGADETIGSFYAGGIVAGQTYLPDGSGDSYTTTIDITSFPPDQLIENPSDIIEVCMNIEHSYLGDLQAYLTCPDGTEITLFEGYGGGGGGTYLGDPIDDFGGGGPGEGWTYCFNDNADMTLLEANAAGIYTTTTIENGNSITPGTYLPEESFDAFVGCPINGEWTITITDNLSIDDGYIFEWSILFDPSINPNTEEYEPIIVDAWWEEDNQVIMNDTSGVWVIPDNIGPNSYTFVVLDNFGCEYDTTIVIDVLPPLDVWLNIDEDEIDVCGLIVDMDMVNTQEGGTWSYFAGPDDEPVITEITFNTHTIEVTEYGNYVFIWHDDYCDEELTATVNFLAAPSITNSEIGPFCPHEYSSLSIQVDGFPGSIEWSTGESGTTSIDVDSTGVYTVEIEGCGVTDMAVFDFSVHDCIVVYPNVISPNNDGKNDALEFPNIFQYQFRELWVYNRWGNLVYHEPSYGNAWDGEDLPEGSYYYILQLDDLDPITSHLTIFRTQ